MFVRKYLERRAAEKAKKDMEADDSETTGGGQKDWSQQGASAPSTEIAATESYTLRHDTSRRIWPFGSSGKDNRRRMGNSSNHGSIDGDPDSLAEPDRQAFRPEHHVQATSSRKTPRSVAIPYSRLKKDRFFDWPPDPTVSRATPMPFREIPEPASPNKTEPPTNRIEVERHEAPLGGDFLPESSAQVPRGLRRRMQAREKSDIPRNLYL